MLAVILVTVLLTRLATDVTASELVTCGSAIKLMNLDFNVKLHTTEDLRYADGSRQQSVTGVKGLDEPGSHWVVRPKSGSECARGDPIKCGDIISLQHVDSKKNLYTTEKFRSPLTNGQEITALDSKDSGSHWRLVCDDELWRRNGKVAFKHDESGVYLSVSGRTYMEPIEGHVEVVGSMKRKAELWVDKEGLYMHPSAIDLKNTNKSHVHIEL